MMNKKLVNRGLQSNKYSIHFSRFIAESWLCSMLRSILLPPKIDNDFNGTVQWHT